MPEIVDFRFRLRRGLAATWTSTNDVLLDGELGLERDTGKLKVGDGSTPWNTLPYIETGLQLGLLADVDATAIADGRMLAWSSAAQKHRYVNPPSGGGGGRTLLYSKMLSANGNFDTNEAWPGGTLPNNYYKYEIEMGLRPVDAGGILVLLTVNGDTTAANYRSVQLFGYTSAGANVQDSRRFGSCNNAVAGIFTKHLAQCLAPDSDHHKEFILNYVRRDTDTAAIFSVQEGLVWENTAAINRMQFTSSGASGNFAAGSFVHVFGV